MSFLEELKNSRATPQAAWTQFVTSYRDGKDEVYLFFEGKDDPGFYSSHLRELLAPKKTIHFQCGGKQKVLEVIPRVQSRLDFKWRGFFLLIRILMT